MRKNIYFAAGFDAKLVTHLDYVEDFVIEGAAKMA
jgi:hypothetical protein